MRLLAGSLVSALAAFALACSVTTDLDGYSSGKAATEPARDDDDEPTSSTSSSGKPPKAPSPGKPRDDDDDEDDDEPASSTSGAAPSVSTLLTEDFAGGCGSWTLAGAGTVTAAAGGCEICATGTGEVLLERSVTTPRAGRASLSMFAYRTGAGGPSSATLAVRNGGSSTTVSRGVGVGRTSVAFSSNSGVNAASGATLTARVGMQNAVAGYCLVVDDIVVTLK